MRKTSNVRQRPSKHPKRKNSETTEKRREAERKRPPNNHNSFPQSNGRYATSKTRIGCNTKKKHSEKKKALLKTKVSVAGTNTERRTKDKKMGNGRDEA